MLGNEVFLCKILSKPVLKIPAEIRFEGPIASGQCGAVGLTKFVYRLIPFH